MTIQPCWAVERGSRRQGVRYSPAQPKAADVLDGMSWREFEMLVGEAFRRVANWP